MSSDVSGLCLSHPISSTSGGPYIYRSVIVADDSSNTMFSQQGPAASWAIPISILRSTLVSRFCNMATPSELACFVSTNADMSLIISCDSVPERRLGLDLDVFVDVLVGVPAFWGGS